MWTKDNIPDQTGKTIIVTGAKVGLGFEAALVLYEVGAHVVLGCRKPKKAEDTLVKLQKVNGKGTFETGVLDLSDLHSVKQFANTFLQKHKQLNVLRASLKT